MQAGALLPLLGTPLRPGTLSYVRVEWESLPSIECQYPRPNGDVAALHRVTLARTEGADFHLYSNVQTESDWTRP